MAYDFFPKDERDITNTLRNWREGNRDDVLRVFMHLKEKHPTPVNIDKSKPGIVNVTRELQGDFSIPQIKKDAGVKTINLKFGNGSSGNRGVNNRGNMFEPQFAMALQNWWDGNEVKDKNMLDAIEDLDKTYDLRKRKSLTISVEGAENTPRPVQYAGNRIYLANPKGTGYDVGPSVTDITLTADRTPIYLSLKLGTTVTFFNVGVRKVLTPEEIKAGMIKNKEGQALLDLFNINPAWFCNVFTGTMKKIPPQRVTNFNKQGIKTLLESGIGYNYHVIHKMSGRIISKKMDKAALQKAANPTSLTVYYGGKTGTGKRIDMEMESMTYKFKLNIRDTQGRDGFPTRLMCDFTYK